MLNRQFLLNVEYSRDGKQYATLLHCDTKEDVGQGETGRLRQIVRTFCSTECVYPLGLVAEGLLLAESRREKRLAKLVADYTKAQDKAKASRVCVFPSF